MLKKLSLGPFVALVIAAGAVVLVHYGLRTAQAFVAPQTEAAGDQAMMPATENGFSVEVLVDGRPVEQIAALHPRRLALIRIGDEAYLYQSGRHRRSDQHFERRLLDSAVLDAGGAVHLFLNILGEAARLVQILLLSEIP